jgi:ubiquitin C-terminal hydrolase
MDALLQSISTKEEIPNYECENCQGRHRAVSSVNIVGSPKYIFFLTGIVQLVEGKHYTYRKCMNFKMDLKEIIDIENNAYHLRTVISHIGDNSHLETKTEQVGHYISYRRVDDVWYCFDDDEVDEVRFDAVGKLYPNENVYVNI